MGLWRVVGNGGIGVHGVVYQGVPLDDPHGLPVALKLALHPDDPRFAREAELLSRLRHLSIPRLYGHGLWRASDGQRYPFVSMEWIAGAPLYFHALQHPPSPAQVALWMAQLASALHALHSIGGVHRDVKGGNVVVRRADGRAFLTDFGTGIYPGAAPLTPPFFLPGTPVYRPPGAALHQQQFPRARSAPHLAGPPDDLYALGVTACKLLTDAYPIAPPPQQNAQGRWYLEAVIPPPELLDATSVEPRLRDLVLGLLSVQPEERGTAHQVSEAFEHAAGATAHPSPQPEPGQAAPSTRERSSAQSPSAPLWRKPAVVPWLVMAGAVALAVGVHWAITGEAGEGASCARAEPTRLGQQDPKPVGLGEAAAAALTESAPPAPSGQEVIAEDSTPEPVPGQMRTDAKGRCPQKGHSPLNGVCWLQLTLSPELCEGIGGQTFKGTCFMPILSRQRQPTSSPLDKR